MNDTLERHASGVDLDAQLRAQILCQSAVIESYRLTDVGQAAKIPNLFTADGRFKVFGEEYDIEAFREITSKRQAVVERDTRHAVVNLSFRSVSDGEAEVTCVLIVYVLSHPDEAQRRIPQVIVDVHDTFVRDGGRWLIKRRVAELVAGTQPAIWPTIAPTQGTSP